MVHSIKVLNTCSESRIGDNIYTENRKEMREESSIFGNSSNKGIVVNGGVGVRIIWDLLRVGERAYR